MSRARDLADIVSGGFDVPLASLDNVPASDDASALTTGTLPAARLPATLPALDGSALTSLSAANLTGTVPNASFPATLPAVNGSALTSLSAANLTGSLPAINGSALTSLSAANLTGSLPAISGANLTGITSGATIYSAVSNLPSNATAGSTAFVQANNSFYVFADNTWHVTESINTDPTQQEFLPNSSITSDGSNLGKKVHMSQDGQTAAATAWYDDNPNSNQGSVNIYQKQSTGKFSFHQRVVASDAASSDYFGSSVTLSDDGLYLAVGAIYEDQSGSSSGAVYVFYRSAITGQFAQQQKLDPSDAQYDDHFGAAVRFNADATYLVASSDEEKGDPFIGFDAGAVYVFTRSGTTWTEQQKLVSSDLEAYDRFGVSVDINDAATYIAVGAYNESRQSSNTMSGLGAVYIFTRSGTTWSQQAKLTSTNVSPITNGGHLGVSVSLDSGANYVACGAQAADAGSTYSVGAVYIFSRSGTTWTQDHQILNSDTSNSSSFGGSCQLNREGNCLVVGAYADDGNDSNGGAVLVYDKQGSSWNLRKKLYHYPTDGTSRSSDYMGYDVAMDASTATIVTGAYGQDQQSSSGGAVYFMTNTFATGNESGLSRPRGSIIEEISGVCDGRTVIGQSGRYTLPNVTSLISLTTSYQALTGSEITYFAPVGTKRIKYQLEVKLRANGYSGISHYRLYVDDVEVTKFRTTRNYSYSSSNQGNCYEVFTWVFDCDGTADAATGTFDGWVGPKTIRMTAREYGSNYEMQLHTNVWMDGTGASGDDVLAEPVLTVTAYA